eukprot:1240765-Karenia_brevis.AAC.1
MPHKRAYRSAVTWTAAHWRRFQRDSYYRAAPPSKSQAYVAVDRAIQGAVRDMAAGEELHHRRQLQLGHCTHRLRDASRMLHAAKALSDHELANAFACNRRANVAKHATAESGGLKLTRFRPRATAWCDIQDDDSPTLSRN